MKRATGTSAAIASRSPATTISGWPAASSIRPWWHRLGRSRSRPPAFGRLLRRRRLVFAVTPFRPSSDLPDVPPAEVLDAVDAAWARAESLASAGLHLHVSVGRVGGRLRARLCLGDEVLAKLTPAQVLAIEIGRAHV